MNLKLFHASHDDAQMGASALPSGRGRGKEPSADEVTIGGKPGGRALKESHAPRQVTRQTMWTGDGVEE